MPTPPCACYGAWEDDRFIGAVVFSPGASQHMPRQFRLPPRAVTELTRVALRDHISPVSQIVTQAVDLLRLDSSGLQLLVSFADPAQGHHGGIYQAMNWLYIGQSAPSVNYRDPRTGTLYHARVVTKDGWTRQYGARKRGHRMSDLVKVEMPGKHRYVLPLNRRIRRQLLKQSQPYPAASERAVEASMVTRSVSG